MTFFKPAFLFLLIFLIGNAGFVFAENEDEPPEIVNPDSDPLKYCSEAIQLVPNIQLSNIVVDNSSEGMKVSIANYKTGEDTLVYVQENSIQASWDHVKGELLLKNNGTASDYETALRNVYYRNLSETPVAGERSFAISLLDADYLPYTKHFYRFVSRNGISWSEARNEASRLNYYGLTGYLATIRSRQEFEFILSKTRGTGWIGASDEKQEGKWEWVTGPDAGVHFWQGNYNGRPVNNEYNNWRHDEPNNLGGEDYGHIMYHVNRGFWNDLPNAGGSGDYEPQGYIVEFGGMDGDPIVNLSAVASIEIVGSTQPEIDEDMLQTLFCGTMEAAVQLAFTGQTPEVYLSALNDSVTVLNETSYAPTIKVPSFGKYYFLLDMTDALGCYYADTLMFEFHNQPAASFNLDEDECYGYSLQLNYSGTTEEDALFTWYYNNEKFTSGINLDSVTIPLGFEDIERNVGLKVNEQGCADSTAQEVKVKPEIIFSAGNTEGCAPLRVDFTASANKPAERYVWDFSDGGLSEAQNPSHTFLNESDSTLFRDIQLTVYATDGCNNTAVYENLVQVFPVPTSDFYPHSYEVLITEPEVVFTNTSHAASHYNWDFGDSSAVSNEIDPRHRYNSLNVYNVTLEAGNDFGCADTIVKAITVAFDKLFPPNAFSPNARLEEDREFRIYSDGIDRNGYHLQVFNRWGEVIFESNSPDKGWDGKMKNEKLAPAGVYTWVLQYKDFRGKAHTQQGTVTLLI